MIFVYWIIAFIILWVFFVNVMWLKYNKEKVPLWLVKPAMAVAVIGIIYDVAFRLFYGTLMFVQPPNLRDFAFTKEYFTSLTLTHQMQAILKTGRGTTYLARYRYYLARFICRYLVEPWDRGHCGLEKLGIGL